LFFDSYGGGWLDKTLPFFFKLILFRGVAHWRGQVGDDRSAPKSVLARHYTDFSSEKLKEIYEKVNIRILRARDTSSYRDHV
jgi:hypothetical protein